MRSITHCLNKQLAELCEHSLKLEELSVKVALFLPQEFALRCQVSSFNKGRLILVTSCSTWASQLHYLLPELRDKLRKEGGFYQLSSIRIAVMESLDSQQKAIRKTSSLSVKAKAILINESQQCQYTPLKKAWLKLARSEGTN